MTPPGTGTGNQTAAPAFVNQAAGNLHQTPASPTLDAGSGAASLLGTMDIDGDARSVDGNCDGTATPDIGADELNPFVDPNNNFANAQVLNGSTATANGTNVSATEEPGEDNYCTEDVCSTNPTVTRSVWYRWTAPGNGPATVDTCAANDFDTMLAVFTGSTLGSLTLAAPDTANNNSPDCPPSSFASKVSFTAAQGTTYQILVDGCCGLPAGTFTLTLNGPSAPPPPPGSGGTVTPAAKPCAARSTKSAATAKKHKKKGCGRKKKKRKGRSRSRLRLASRRQASRARRERRSIREILALPSLLVVGKSGVDSSQAEEPLSMGRNASEDESVAHRCRAIKRLEQPVDSGAVDEVQVLEVEHDTPGLGALGFLEFALQGRG